jgi:hypothetical protein
MRKGLFRCPARAARCASRRPGWGEPARLNGAPSPWDEANEAGPETVETVITRVLFGTVVVIVGAPKPK